MDEENCPIRLKKATPQPSSPGQRSQQPVRNKLAFAEKSDNYDKIRSEKINEIKKQQEIEQRRKEREAAKRGAYCTKPPGSFAKRDKKIWDDDGILLQKSKSGPVKPPVQRRRAPSISPRSSKLLEDSEHVSIMFRKPPSKAKPEPKTERKERSVVSKTEYSDFLTRQDKSHQNKEKLIKSQTRPKRSQSVICQRSAKIAEKVKVPPKKKINAEPEYSY